MERRRHDDGFSLAEMIVAMTIVAMLTLAGIGAYLRARETGEATRNRERVEVAYQAIARCKSENDGFYASYADLKGSYCLSSLTLEGNTRLCALDRNSVDACSPAPSGTTEVGSCWLPGTAYRNPTEVEKLWPSPASGYADTADSGERGFRVGLCTFSTNAAGTVTDNAADSQHVRLSASRGDRIYYFVESPLGFATYIADDDNGDGRPDSGTCLRRTSGAGPQDCVA